MTTAHPEANGSGLRRSKFLAIEFGLQKMMPATFLHWSAHLDTDTPLALRGYGISLMSMDSSSPVFSSSPCCSLLTNGGVSCRRLLLVFLEAWNTWVHYATFHLPPEPNGFYGYNALQQIAYFAVVFVFGVLAILTGIAMSPAVVNRFPWYAKIFGGRQAARSIHFLTMLGFLSFLVVHVTLIVMTGFVRNMNHIVVGTDDQGIMGMLLGFAGIGLVILSWVAAHYLSWFHPRGLQHALKSVTYPMQLLTLNRLAPRQKYSEEQISPYFWPNGKMPIRDDWKRMAEGGFDKLPAKGGRPGRKAG